MSEIATITPSVLKWARETSGYTEEDVVDHFHAKKVTINTVRNWEVGELHPDYSQLKKLSKLYKRPIAIFFFPEAPEEETIEQDFRTLPSIFANKVQPKIRYLIREAKVRLIDLQELHSDNVDISINSLKAEPEETAEQLAQRFRNILGVSIEEQTSWDNAEVAFKKWQNRIESLGIWIFKKAFFKKNNEYFGFCLYNENFPIIYIHNGCSFQRQIFTLFHELAHILRGKAGIYFRSNQDFTGRYEEEEVFCNAFAGEFLLPNSELNYSKLPSDETIKKLADKYKISFDVVLRKYLDRGLISSDEYEQKIAVRQHYFRNNTENKPKGGNYYYTQMTYLGYKYTKFVFNQYYQQRITQEQVADYFDIKQKNINSFETAFHERMTR